MALALARTMARAVSPRRPVSGTAAALIPLAALLAFVAACASEARRELASSAAPIVLLEATGPARLPDAVAPGFSTLGFMLPTTPLHLLLLDGLDRPLVMTSTAMRSVRLMTSCSRLRVRWIALANSQIASLF